MGEGKRIYVWYDAVIGYLSASQEWASKTEDKEKWRHWWHNDDARHVYFIGKDNIPFHALFWPAQLIATKDAIGGENLHLPDDIPANQYVTFKGGKASASRGVGLTIAEGLEKYQPDALRYALAANFPEQADTEISEEEIIRRINDELVSNWGNLVNRVLSMAYKNSNKAIPHHGELTQSDQALLNQVDEALQSSSKQFDQVELRAALRTAMETAQATNRYLNATEPWKVLKEDQERGLTILFVALSAINGIRIIFRPFLPFSSQTLDLILGEQTGWERQELISGAPLEKPIPLFRKVEINESQE